MAVSGAGIRRSGVWLALVIGLLALHALATFRVVPGDQAVGFGQLAQMLGYLKERSVAFLFGP